MAKPSKARSRGRGSVASDVRTILVAQEDVAAAQGLLLLLADASQPDGDPGESFQAKLSLLRAAKRALALRQRRMQVLGEGFTSEAPFAMLVALYTTKDEEPGPTITRLADLASVPTTTSLRWLDQLIVGGWVARSDDACDGRKARLRLSAAARAALEDVFSQSSWA